jgi:hypothetical protein
MGKFGKVVAIVADSDDKIEETKEGDSVMLSERSAYSPIIGGSFVLIP